MVKAKRVVAGHDQLYQERALYSKQRLDELRKRLARLPEAKAYPNLAIFAAGSFGRQEASKHSDLDLFFLIENDKEVSEPRTQSLRLFARMIEIARELGFQKFSNDCEYLRLMPMTGMVNALGGQSDDHDNFFTARMLMLLEGQCVYGQAAFDKAVRSVVASYFKDFPKHKLTFQPIFLVNDICRFWKTLLLNYEHKRGPNVESPDYEKRRTKQRVRNFKLKFSRMTTCFATLAALSSCRAPVADGQVIEITTLSLLCHLRSGGGLRRKLSSMARSRGV